MGLDWEKARRRDRARAKRHTPKRPDARAGALTKFVAGHNLACFVCTEKSGPWAKTGVSARGPWAICARCVNHQSD